MFDFDRATEYINLLTGKLPQYLEDIRAEAVADKVPIIRREAGQVMKYLITQKKPERILEIGSAVGFSALLMAEYCGDNCTITTIENYQKRIVKAKDNFAKYDKKKIITLIEGDANEELKKLEGKYDFVFMDAAKGQYLSFLPEVERLLAPEGIMICDNVLQDGDVFESHFLIERRDRTIHERMREFLYEITHSESFETMLLPVGDGMSVSVKK